MRAMVLEKPRQPLVPRDVPKPKPRPGQLLVRVATCAVCRTDLHVFDGELPDPKLPLILGHQIAGRIEEIGGGAKGFPWATRFGFPCSAWPAANSVICHFNAKILAIAANFTGTTTT